MGGLAADLLKLKYGGRKQNETLRLEQRGTNETRAG